MKYTGPKFKLCRREGINLFGPEKYDVKQRKGLPGQHGANIPRLSEFGKLLRNKQVLKRLYFLSEKQFAKLVKEVSAKYAKNKGLPHDKVLLQFLERRCDAVLVKSGIAKTIMQARQMIVHGHFDLNGTKHNVPSAYLKPSDMLSVRKKLQESPLYQAAFAVQTVQTPMWIKLDKSAFGVQLLDLPNTEENHTPVDLLKVIEFYARA